MTPIEKIIGEFKKLVYEPEHESGTGKCWCGVTWKRDNVKMEIVHKEQRIVLAAFLRASLQNQMNDFLNQPANQHDQLVRQATIEEVREVIPKQKDVNKTQVFSFANIERTNGRIVSKKLGFNECRWKILTALTLLAEKDEGISNN